jgi:hypothetical protein
LLLPSVAGAYIRLNRQPVDEIYWSDSEGLFRIIAAPMIKVAAYKSAFRYDGWKGTATGTPHADGLAPVMHYKEIQASEGRHRESQFVAVMTLRVESYRKVQRPLDTSILLNEDLVDAGLSSGTGIGLYWSVYADAQAKEILCTGDVVDPGGSPTGAPASIRGLTLDPRVIAGKNGLKAELIPLTRTNATASYPYSQEPTKTNYANSGSGLGSDQRGACILFGIHDQIGRFGKHFSRAFFSIKGGIDSGAGRARMVILADTAGLVDGFDDGTRHGDIGGDGVGTISEGYPRRLGPGVLMDGGLGLVQATAFRAAPRNKQTEHLGQLTVWGRGAYPFYNGLKPADIGMELPSTFNTSEFHGEVSIANPQGRVVFESPWAAEGLVGNMLTAQFASRHYVGPHHYGFKGIRTLSAAETYAVRQGGLGMSDTLFPYPGSGLVFRTPGTTVYERAFRSLDATGSDPHRKSKAGSHNRSGIAGMGIPFRGEVLLLPQGPPSRGFGRADWRKGSGMTPLDIPLYEFVNGTPEFQKGMFSGKEYEVPYSQLQGGHPLA